MEQNNNITSGLIWRFFESTSTQIVSFIIQMVLARLLLPEDFGIIAITVIFIILANVFIETGLTTSLIQKENNTQEELSTVYWTVLLISIGLYLCILRISPNIEQFLSIEHLSDALNAQALIIIIGAFGSIHNMLIIKQLAFKKMFKFKFFGAIIQGIIGILLAINGFGVWSLIYSNIVYSFFITFGYWYIVRWVPSFKFKYGLLKNLLPFSINILIMNFFNALFNSAQSIVMAKFYPTSMLGFYNRGQQIPVLIMNNIDGTINAVMFSALSKVQSDEQGFLELFRKTLKISLYIVIPLMVGLIVTSEFLIFIVFGEGWSAAIPFLIITSLTCMTWPFSLTTNALNALGITKIALYLNLGTKICTLILMYFSIDYGINAILYSILIGSLLSTAVGFFLAKSYFYYSYIEQIKDILPIFAISLLMGACVYSLSYLITNFYVLFIIQTISGIVIYICLSLFFKISSFNTIYEMLKNKIIK